MHKRSHKLLASALLRSGRGFSSRRYEWAFLLGSFQPDCNPLTYLKGSLHGRRFGGHTFGNARPFINTRIQRLQDRESWNVWHYYTLGKLTHYLSDAFTFPHNDSFCENLAAHHVYERNLHQDLKAYLSCRELQPAPTVGDLESALDAMHRQYLSQPSASQRDIQYIVHATGLLMACCQPQEPAVSRHVPRLLESLRPLPKSA